MSLALCSLLIGVEFAAASIEALGYLALAAIFPQLIGHTLLTWSLRYTTPTVVGITTLGPLGYRN